MCKKMFCVLLTFAIAIITSSVRASETNIKVPDAGLYFSFWDAQRELLIFYRDAHTPDDAAVKVYAGSTLRMAIFPLKDFPSASELGVWAVSALPNGDIALSGVLDFGNQQTKLVLLTYAADGSLKKLWDMQTRHNYNLVADGQGNIYAFGFPVELGDSAQSNYMMLAKYSPSGKVLREFLPRKGYAHLAKATMLDPSNGQSALLIWHDRLVLYFANACQVLWFDTDGNLLRTVNLDSLLKSVAKKNKSESARIERFSLTAEGNYLAQVSLLSTDTSNVVLQVSQDGDKWQTLTSNAEQVLGIDSQNQYIVLRTGEPNQVTLAKCTRLP